MARRKKEDENKRSLFGLAGNKSTAITLPLNFLRELGWKIKDNVICSVKNDSLIIKKLK